MAYASSNGNAANQPANDPIDGPNPTPSPAPAPAGGPTYYGGPPVGGNVQHYADPSNPSGTLQAHSYDSGQDMSAADQSLGGRPTIYNPDGTVAQLGTADQLSQQFQADANAPAYIAPGYNDLHNDQVLGGQSRNAETDALGLDQAAANGTAPSQAVILGQKMNQDALNNAASTAASARGGPMQQAAALGAAQRQAGLTSAEAAQTEEAARAAEMANARTTYGQEAGAIRGGDISQEGTDINQVQAEQQQQQAQAQLGYNYNALSLKPLEDNQTAAENAANNNNSNFQQQRTIANAQTPPGGAIGQFGAIAGPIAGVGMGVAGVVGAMGGGKPQAGTTANGAPQVGSGGTTAGPTQAAPDPTATDTSGGQSPPGAPPDQSASGSDWQGPGGFAHGGELRYGGKGYVVGEHGPELIIPDKPGYVMTAHQTAALLGGGGPTPQQARYLAGHDADPRADALAMGGPMRYGCAGARAQGGMVLPQVRSAPAVGPVQQPWALPAPVAAGAPVSVGRPPPQAAPAPAGPMMTRIPGRDDGGPVAGMAPAMSSAAARVHARARQLLASAPAGYTPQGRPAA